MSDSYDWDKDDKAILGRLKQTSFNYFPQAIAVAAAMKDVPREVVFIQEKNGNLTIQCGECSWHREFGTLNGAKTGLTEHRLAVHRIRTNWLD
jgi:hypothetical protein